MASLVPVTEELLAHVGERLRAITPEQFEAPEDDVPFEPIHLMGYATPAQRAMQTLWAIANREHRELHEATGLEFGAHKGLPIEHRRLHIVINVLEIMLYEDLTNTFEEVGEKQVYIDPQWRVYWVEE